MTRTRTNHRPNPEAVKELVGPPQAARRPGPRGVYTNNPLRISRIGTDHLQVFIRPVQGCTELLALVERLEQLIDVGYDAIDVVFETATRDPSVAPDVAVLARNTMTASEDTGTSTDAMVPPLARA